MDIKKLIKSKYAVYAVLAAGVLLLLVGGGITKKTARPTAQSPPSVSADSELYIARLEERVQNALSKISGVGRVAVTITLSKSSEAVVASDVRSSERTTKSGDVQKEADTKNIIVRESPVIITEFPPQAEGVVVIAEGGGADEVKAKIIEAVMALVNVKVHKIAVFAGA